MPLPLNPSEQPIMSAELKLDPPPSVLSVAVDAFTFFLAASGSFVVQLIGELPIATLILLPVAPILIALRPERLQRKRLLPLFVLLGIWLIGQGVTDLYRGTNSADWLRTMARILFLGLWMLCLAILVGQNTRRQALFLAGFAVGSLLQAFLQPSDLAEADPWKFGYSAGITGLVVLLSCIFFRRQKIILVLLFMAAAVLNLTFNFRSPILVLFITLVLVVPIPAQFGSFRLLPSSRSPARVVLLIVLAVVAGKSAESLVLLLTAQGVLGEAAQEKNMAQSEAKAGLLLGGRSEILVSSRAVLDSPFLGHGSWAKDLHYVEMYHDLRASYGMKREEELTGEDEERDLIPTHSHLMGSWVDAGLCGALFWIYVFCLVAKGIASAGISPPPLAPVYVYKLTAFLWDILFSPAASRTILPEAFLLIVVIDLLHRPFSTDHTSQHVLLPWSTRDA